MATPYDVIVIGGGHNGLVCAAYLARAGRRVLVLERREQIGGAAVTEEVFPGFKFSVFSYVVSLLRPEIIRDLDLPRHGLHILPLESTLTPLPNGDYLAQWNDHDQNRRELARHSLRDAEAVEEFGRLMHEMARAVKPLLGMVPPDPGSLAPRDLLGLARLTRHLRGLGARKFHALCKLLTMSAADYLDEWFETEALKATKSASGIIGTLLGPRSPGTAYVLLHHYMGEIDGVFRAWGFAKGGNGSVAEAIAGAARASGAEIRTNAPVAQVLLANGRATGVVLESGEEIRGKLVVSGADPRRTFLQLAGEKHLPGDFVEAIQRYRFRGSSGKVNLALGELPNFSCLPGRGPHASTRLRACLRGAISISPSTDYLERAYDDAKYGNFSRRPYLDIVIPSMIDPSMAPPGKHVMSIFVQYAPYHVNGGWTNARREAFGDAVIDTLAEYAPNIKSAILHRQVITPADIEHIVGLSEGNIFQGELTLQQMFFLRPVPAWAQYKTPIRGLYQCGSGTHPGGGVMGASGRNAALVILRAGA
ncbi:MAG: amine oxidase [Betaproteobacteria bacterium RIFCSPLOWO2_12_FULL_62_13]|nr:MAG: amine oxidase [Betaproteobacteria bacterium RIFCSPLOWO2_12_FULL_62_13]